MRVSLSNSKADNNISQGSVATRLRCGGSLIIALLHIARNMLLKEF